MAENEEQQYDTNAIIQQANEKFAQNELEAAQMIYQSALLDWVDDAREMENNDAGGDNSKEISVLKDSIALLWIEYANLNRKANMFKAATDAYEQAVDCPIAGNMGKIWKEYANFQQERKRYKSSQKIYLRALVGDKKVGIGMVTDIEEQNMLWGDFLEMMRRINNDEALTLDQLREAVDSEHTVKARQARIQAEVAAAMEMIDEQQPPPLKRPKVETNNNTKQQLQTITAEAVESVSSALIETTKNISPELNAEWLARDGDASPTRPEPPLFSPSPPKLGDPSGKDLLGTELALKLIRLLLNKTKDGTSSVSAVTGSTILDIVNGCWMMTALKEKEAAKSQEALDKKLTVDYEKMEAGLESRLSAAGNLSFAVQQINAGEKDHFLKMCNEQRKKLSSLVSWEFRHLLAIQQEILTKVGLPFFDGPTVDLTSIQIQSNICTFLHSAFYLRNRITEKSHVAMLIAQEAKLTSQQPVPMPMPQSETKVYHMPPPPLPVPHVPMHPMYAMPQQPIISQPLYAAQQPIPSQFPPPPPYNPVTYPGQPQNQYQYP